ncbi:THAP domain-containing protein 10-like isoform X3 [Thalassophryne amazonica]|uniref:THAP domain-containing protein 10-like isoform X3 n=1 Tax=Thalassophryne amazonica TaxID=390379 RepID=UPI0014712A86|nr:THAP domain-containing protein 10-like isoform X3 [Thalassophryne amazonica]
MPDQCVAAYCTNTRAKGFSLYRFPQDKNLREKWVQQVRRTRSGPTKGTLWRPTTYSFLCCAHFEDGCFDTVPALKKQFGINVRLKKVLLEGAVPSIFPRGTSTSTAKPVKRRKSATLEKRRRLEILQECLPGASSDVGEQRRDGPSADNDAPVDLQMVSTLPQTPASNTSESTTATTISEAVASSTNEVTNPFYQPHPNVWSLHPAETKVETVDKPIVEPVVTSQLPAETKVQTIDHPILQLMSLHPAKTKVEAVNHVDIFRSVKHVGCQTEVGVLARRKTVGTQVSLRTLTKRRDRASQVKVRCQDLGVGTTTVPLDRLQIFIQPTVTETSPKRPRLSLQREDCG